MKGDKTKFIYYISITFFSVVVLTCNLEAVTLTVGSNSGSPGEKNIPILINLSSAPGEEVCGFNLDLNFDTSRLSFKEVTIGPKAEEAGKLLLSFSQPYSDIVRIVVFGFSQNIIENGTVLNFTFDILSSAQSGKAGLIINNPAISDCDTNANLLPVTTKNGEIIVEEEPPDSTTTTSTNTPTTTPTTIITTSTSTTTIIKPDTTTTTTAIQPSPTTTSSSTSTTTSTSQLWPLLYNEMWGNKKDQNLLLLRSFRDEILLNAEPGMDYVFLLYDNSLEIAILLFLDPSSTKLAAEVINEILHGVESLLYNDEVIISRKTINDFESLLNQLEPKASPGLKTVIKKVKKDIREEVIFKQLGIKTIEY